jgi:transposase-like protein
MKVYSEGLKRSAVQKFLSRGNRSIAIISQETGVSATALYNWSKEFAHDTGAGMKAPERRPQDLSAAQKMKAVMEFEALPESEQGLYLRREGFMSEHLSGWKKVWQQALESGSNDAPGSRAEWTEMNRRLKELERDLRRKNEALAETSALLVLKKKADLIWGTHEDASP